ncbi:unnamed protein product, partial [Discosporangium mesarthrocarpum]
GGDGGTHPPPLVQAQAKQGGCVQRLLGATISLQSRRGGLEALVDHLLTFVFTHASAVGEETQHGLHELGLGLGLETLNRSVLEEGTPTGAGRDGVGATVLERTQSMQGPPFLLTLQGQGGRDSPAASSLRLTGAAAAVLLLLARYTTASATAGTLVLSHLAGRRGMRQGVTDPQMWLLFCTHVLGFLLDQGPPKVRLTMAVDAHRSLKGVVGAPSSLERADACQEEEVSSPRQTQDLMLASNQERVRVAMSALFDRLEGARQTALREPSQSSSSSSCADAL